jgi:hypothetical protein
MILVSFVCEPCRFRSGQRGRRNSACLYDAAEKRKIGDGVQSSLLARQSLEDRLEGTNNQYFAPHFGIGLH